MSSSRTLYYLCPIDYTIADCWADLPEEHYNQMGRLFGDKERALKYLRNPLYKIMVLNLTLESEIKYE